MKKYPIIITKATSILIVLTIFILITPVAAEALISKKEAIEIAKQDSGSSDGTYKADLKKYKSKDYWIVSERANGEESWRWVIDAKEGIINHDKALGIHFNAWSYNAVVGSLTWMIVGMIVVLGIAFARWRFIRLPRKRSFLRISISIFFSVVFIPEFYFQVQQ